MFQIPKIPKSTQNLVQAAMSGTALVSNIFEAEFANFSIMQASAIAMTTGLIPFNGSNWTLALQTQLIAVLTTSLPALWAQQNANSAATIANLALNASNIRYNTIINQAMSSVANATDACSEFLNDSLATISEDLFDTAKTVDTAIARFCIAALPLQGIIPDTDKEVGDFNNCASLAQDILAYAENFGVEIAAALDLQSYTQQKLNELAMNFAQAAGLASMVNDPCARQLFEIAGSPQLQEALGVKDKASQLLESKEFNSFRNLFGV